MNKIIAFLIALTFSLKAAATNYYVNDGSTAGNIYTTAVGNNGNPGTAALPFASLGFAIGTAAIGDTIYVDAGFYNEVNLSIGKSLTIIGAGSGSTEFTGNATVNRFATITSNSVTIKNITLSNYYLNGNGQVITMSGRTGILFENMVVKDNQGALVTGVNFYLLNSEVTFRGCIFKCSGWNADGGGTIWADNSTLLVENCAFKNVFNFATSGRGGAIEITGANSNVIVTETVFDECTARRGGAIFQNHGILAVDNSCFSNNYTQGDASDPSNGGGAYCANNADAATIATFTNCTFQDNFINPSFAQFSANASCDGGCVQLEDASGTYTFDKCSFDNLHANPGMYDKGQDFYLEHVGTISVSITNSSFTTSQEGNGADQANIYNNDLAAGELFITNCGSLGTGGSYTLTGAATQSLGAQIWEATFSNPNTDCIDVSNIADCGIVLDCATEILAPIIISCVPDQTITDCSALLDYTLLVSAYDDCSYFVTQSPLAGTILPNGTHPVTMTVTDAAGNFTTCVFDVVVSGCAPCTNPTPTVGATQSFCLIDSPKIADLAISGGATIVWYDAITGGITYNSGDALINGDSYWAADETAGCDPSVRFEVVVIISDPAAPTGDAAQSFCSIDLLTVADIDVTGTGVIWYTNLAGTIVASAALADDSSYYATQTIYGCESDTRLQVDVTISDPANNTSITPQTSSLSIGNAAGFTATTSDPNPIYIWQCDFGQGFQPLNNFGNYSGVNSATLNISNVQLANHNQTIRTISTSGDCIDTSNVAVINILDTCITNVTVTDTNFVTVTDTAYIAINDTTFISVMDTLIINAILTGLNPPSNQNTLKVFPNPASTHITIDYGNFSSMSGYTLKITNNLGQVVFTTPVNQQSSYIDLSTWSGIGIYFVQIIDTQNNTIENRKILIQ